MLLFAQTASEQGAQQPNMLVSFFPLIIIFAIFYFIIIMPARKKQKQHQALISGLSGGERVITAGGIYGTIGRVMEDRIEVIIDKNTTIQVTKGSIATVIQPDQQYKSQAEK
jgi:preprotein translocase subunit YajC